MNIKKEFGLTHLLDIFAFIDYKDDKTYFDHQYQTSFKEVSYYANIIKNTKITKEMIFGDKAIFEGFEVGENNKLVEYTYYTDRLKIMFYKEYVFENESVQKIEAYTIKDDGWQVGQSKFIKTLSDLAELTKDSPIKLR